MVLLLFSSDYYCFGIKVRKIVEKIKLPLLLLFVSEIFMTNNWKNKEIMNAKLLGFVAYVEVIIHLLLLNGTFNFKRQTPYKSKTLELETEGFLYLLVLV